VRSLSLASKFAHLAITNPQQQTPAKRIVTFFNAHLRPAP
jgi:hypothetical protein